VDQFIFLFLGLGYTGLFLWGIFLVRKRGLFQLSNVLLLVIFGLMYNNFLIGFGNSIGGGNLLETLSYGRFWLHALFTPTLILFAWSIYDSMNLNGNKNTVWKTLAYLITVILIIYEFLSTINNLNLKPHWENSILTYISTSESNNSFMVMIVTLIIGFVGFILMRKAHFPWLLYGTIVMVLGGILAIWIKHSAIMNIFEFIFIISLMVTKQHVINKR